MVKPTYKLVASKREFRWCCETLDGYPHTQHCIYYRGHYYKCCGGKKKLKEHNINCPNHASILAHTEKCVYCFARPGSTVDHVPSRHFAKKLGIKPFVVRACPRCNHSLDKDKDNILTTIEERRAYLVDIWSQKPHTKGWITKEMREAVKPD